MYVPPAFREDDPDTLAAMIREVRLATLVTSTAEGILATSLPLIFDPAEGERETLHGHVAKANPQWREPAIGEALAIFMGPDAYITPSWYAAKREHGKVVPTWNYTAVHAYGVVEFFEDPSRLLGVVTKLTNLHEGQRTAPWSVSDAPTTYVESQLKGIVGVRIPVSRLVGKRKLSQNRSAADREGVASGLTESDRATDHVVAGLIPQGSLNER